MSTTTKPPSRLTKWLVAALLLVASSGEAAADDLSPGEWELAVSPSYAYVQVDGAGEPSGGGAGWHMRLGLTDSFALQLAGVWSAHPVETDDTNGVIQLFNLAIGLSYAVDLNRFAPKLEAGVGWLYRTFDGKAASDLGIRVGLALDYRLSEHIAVGMAVHLHAFVVDPSNIPIYVHLGPRLALRWNGL